MTPLEYARQKFPNLYVETALRTDNGTPYIAVESKYSDQCSGCVADKPTKRDELKGYSDNRKLCDALPCLFVAKDQYFTIIRNNYKAVDALVVLRVTQKLED